MKLARYALLVLAGALLLPGCRQGAAPAAEKYRPYTLEDTDQEGIRRVILDARAAERIGLETAEVREEQVTVAGRTATRRVVPYGALMYDTKGETWAYTSPAPLTFVRHKVQVENIAGDRVVLADGPPVGTRIVTVGAAELMGAEHKYGH